MAEQKNAMNRNQIYKHFADYIEKELGIIYSPDSDYYQLRSRLDDIIRFKNFAGLDDLFQYTIAHGISGDLRQLLLDVATNNETLFFRDPRVFETIESDIYDEIVKARGFGSIKVWSAACSFGQEPYSLAIQNCAMRKENPKIPLLSITATDISSEALEYASKGIYSQLEVQRGLNPRQLIGYFENVGENRWKLLPSAKCLVRFRKQNLLHLHEMREKFDMILCRNVLIYQSVDRKAKIIDEIADRLNPGGILFLGTSETILGVSKRFELKKYANGTVCFGLKE